MTHRASLIACTAALALIAFAVYAQNLTDYFLSDDFDLIQSFYGKPTSYFFKLLFANESGTVWASLGLTPDSGFGYLRPLKIWLMKLDLTLWGAHPTGFHVTATLFFALNVIVVFRILDLLAPRRLPFAFLGAFVVAIHPVFSEIVPSITFREETVTSFLSLLSFHAFLRYRLHGRSLPVFYLAYALALLTKESGIGAVGLAVGYDLVHGHFRATRTALRRQLVLYAPVAGILAGYFGLRWLAFGNPIGGDGSSAYLSPQAFFGFHVKFFKFLFHEKMFLFHAVPFVGLWCALLLATGVVTIALRREQLDRSHLRNLVVVGPVWYLVSTLVPYGVYFAPRHNVLPVIGVVMFATLLLEAVVRCLRPRPTGRRMVVAVAIAACTLALLPPTIALGRLFHVASGLVEKARAQIERETAGLPEGSTILLRNVPQFDRRPFYFGWALQSALKRPFTESDLANKSLVINFRNIHYNNYQVSIPERFDREITLTGSWPFEEPPDW